jgi:hypothetical protein
MRVKCRALSPPMMGLSVTTQGSSMTTTDRI